MAILGCASDWAVWFLWTYSIIEPCSHIGLSLSLIFQLTSEDIKRHNSSSNIPSESSGAVWKSRWPSWAFHPNDSKMSLMVSVDIKQHWAMLKCWSQFVPNISTDIKGHEALLHNQHSKQSSGAVWKPLVDILGTWAKLVCAVSVDVRHQWRRHSKPRSLAPFLQTLPQLVGEGVVNFFLTPYKSHAFKALYTIYKIFEY